MKLDAERLTHYRDRLMSVQAGHTVHTEAGHHYDPDDVMNFIAVTSRVLLALVTDLLEATEQ